MSISLVIAWLSVFSPTTQPDFLPIVKHPDFRYFLRFVETAEQTLARNVEERLKALKTNAFAVESAANLPEDAVRSILRGGKKSGTTLNRAKAVCDALGLDFYIGPRRTAPTSGSNSPTGLGEGGSGGDRDVRVLPWLEPRIGQGSAPVGFSLSWLASEGLVIDRLRAVIADQVQLPGGLALASLAIVEVPSRPTEEPESWAFYEKGRLIVARLHVDGDLTIVLPADGARARLYRKTDLSFRLLGRVVWLAVVRP